jgi:hypothetical protein
MAGPLDGIRVIDLAAPEAIRALREEGVLA